MLKEGTERGMCFNAEQAFLPCSVRGRVYFDTVYPTDQFDIDLPFYNEEVSDESVSARTRILHHFFLMKDVARGGEEEKEMNPVSSRVSADPPARFHKRPYVASRREFAFGAPSLLPCKDISVVREGAAGSI